MNTADLPVIREPELANLNDCYLLVDISKAGVEESGRGSLKTIIDIVANEV